LTNTVYALDSTTIDLCCRVFPWAHFRTTKAAVKMHTLLDLRGNIPSFIHVSDGKTGRTCMRSICCFPKPVPSMSWTVAMSISPAFMRWHQSRGLFVTRTKSNTNAHRVYSAPTDRTTGIICDQVHCPGWPLHQQELPRAAAPCPLRDAESGQDTGVSESNHFALPALTIAALYKNRWQWSCSSSGSSSNLRIKQFYGTSENAVKTQIWIAVSVYVLVAIVRKHLGLDASLYTLLTDFFGHPLREKIDLNSTYDGGTQTRCFPITKQLNLFVF